MCESPCPLPSNVMEVSCPLFSILLLIDIVGFRLIDCCRFVDTKDIEVACCPVQVLHLFRLCFLHNKYLKKRKWILTIPFSMLFKFNFTEILLCLFQIGQLQLSTMYRATIISRNITLNCVHKISIVNIASETFRHDRDRTQ